MNIKKIFGFAAIAGLLFVAAPTQQASAMSLNSPGIASSVQGNASANEGLTTQVQYRHHGGWRGHRGFRRHHGWRRPHFVHRHHGWGRPHHYHRRNWR
jgi:hypothetical protein